MQEKHWAANVWHQEWRNYGSAKVRAASIALRMPGLAGMPCACMLLHAQLLCAVITAVVACTWQANSELCDTIALHWCIPLRLLEQLTQQEVGCIGRIDRSPGCNCGQGLVEEGLVDSCGDGGSWPTRRSCRHCCVGRLAAHAAGESDEKQPCKQQPCHAGQIDSITE